MYTMYKSNKSICNAKVSVNERGPNHLTLQITVTESLYNISRYIYFKTRVLWKRLKVLYINDIV